MVKKTETGGEIARSRKQLSFHIRRKLQSRGEKQEMEVRAEHKSLWGGGGELIQ